MNNLYCEYFLDLSPFNPYEICLYRTYNSLWADAQDDLGVVLEKDQELQGTFHQDVSHASYTLNR